MNRALSCGDAGCTLPAVRARAPTALAIAVSLAGCSTWFRPVSEMPPECSGFAEGTTVVWHAYGKPSRFGLGPVRDATDLEGDIYVEGEPVLPRPGPFRTNERMFCLVVPAREGQPPNVFGIALPPGWEPPQATQDSPSPTIIDR